MAKASELPSDWQDQLKQDGDEKRKTEVAGKYRKLMKEADAIPLRAKTQYPTYIEGRMLHLMRGVSVIEGVSVQDFIRKSIQEALDRRMRAAAKAVTTKKKRVTKKGS